MAETHEKQLDSVAGKAPPDVVIPPKEIREGLEKTAGFVARNGPAFEERIRQKEANNPKLSFLIEADPYHTYYVWRLSEIKAGRGTDASAGRVPGQEGSNAPIPEKGPERPPDFEFSARMPTISAQDLDLLRTTAVFAARNGPGWIADLARREAQNYQYDFLRSQHSLNPFFTRLVDQYRILVESRNPPSDKAQKEKDARIAELTKMLKDKFYILERAKRRAEYTKHQERQKVMQEEDAEKERIEYAQIDWHDFTIVETIEFTKEDDEQELPPPTSKNELQSASLEQMAMMRVGADRRIEEAMPFEDYSANGYPSQLPPSQLSAPIPAQVPMRPTSQNNDYAAEQQSEELPEDMLMRERQANRDAAAAAQAAARGQQGPMKIRSDYVPRAQLRRNAADMAICPICKNEIPHAELDQHIRMETRAQEAKTQQAKATSRSSTSNLLISDAAQNLKRLASGNPEIFDSATGQPLNPEEIERLKRHAPVEAAPSPGIPNPDAQFLSIPEQLARIRAKANGGR